MEGDKTLLADPVSYWDKRHRTTDEWRSGGDKAVDVYRNRAFYAHRLGLLASILDRHQLRPSLRILDAGCGKGWLSEQLAWQGHTVFGIDTSERAIEICRDRKVGEFHVSALDSFRSLLPFDAVISMDVLFHILDEESWARSLANLAAHTAIGGALVVSEIPGAERVGMGNYIVHRPVDEYVRVLEPFGMRFAESVPYAFAGNPNAFLIFRK